MALTSDIFGLSFVGCEITVDKNDINQAPRLLWDLVREQMREASGVQ